MHLEEGLEEGLEVGGHSLRLALRHMREHVALEMHHAPLPPRLRQFDGDGLLDRLVVVARDEANAFEPPFEQVLE